VSSTRFREDILGQPGTLQQIVDFYGTGDGRALLTGAVRLLGHDRLVATGMGASTFALHATRAALAAGTGALWLEETGFLAEQGPAAAVPPAPLLLVSQSGETIEGRNLLASRDRAAEFPVVVLTRDSDSSLASAADVVLPLCVEADLSVAIKTYTGSVAILALLAAELAGAGVGGVRTELLDCAAKLQRLLEPLEDWAGQVVDAIAHTPQIYVVGRKTSFASALGTALLVKETAKRACEGLSSSQFRHGAIEVVADRTVTIVFGGADPATHPFDLTLINELLGYGSRVVLVCDERFPEVDGAAMCVRLPAGPSLTSSILEIVPMQLMSHRLALRDGVSPGEFRNTVPVIVHA